MTGLRKGASTREGCGPHVAKFTCTTGVLRLSGFGKPPPPLDTRQGPKQLSHIHKLLSRGYESSTLIMRALFSSRKGRRWFPEPESEPEMIL
ncbi:hypothetical protein NPIL_387351 [Nephila pilipes]|uniref:Uncharacterized protein n=1 Tax=Nephila pilipes TaxID=299642 RepID=A0A8X6U784_NEPPI|nr:hypothetical protein NPIL_387351 [Nephila pilipes]